MKRCFKNTKFLAPTSKVLLPGEFPRPGFKPMTRK